LEEEAEEEEEEEEVLQSHIWQPGRMSNLVSCSNLPPPPPYSSTRPLLLNSNRT
jgi:hypothetical protein